jgi:hypothetical protein
MADAELPKSWSDAGRIALGNSLWILPLVAIELALLGHLVEGAIAAIAWVVAMFAAVKLHVLQDLLSNRDRRQQLLTWAFIIGGAVALAFGIFRLATQGPATVTSDQQPSPTSDQLAAERRGREGLERQLATTRTELQNTLAQLEQERQKHAAPPPPATAAPAANQAGPINWNLNGQFLVVSGGGPDAKIHNVLFQGTSTAPVRITQAFAVSDLTGRRQEIKANVPYRGYYPVNEVDIPSEANVQLVLIWDPPLSIADFQAQWGKFRIVVSYDDTHYEHRFDENFIRRHLEQMIPGVFGPRVTPRGDK